MRTQVKSPRNNLRRAVIATTVGTTIEWYDFLLYGQMAALVFPKLFFPLSDPLTGALAAFAVLAVGFFVRPFGAVIFGHFGDRAGRKAALVATLLLTGFATFLIGWVPTYERIGVWGAILMVVLRCIQGIGLGGEWGGSILLAMEWAGRRHRGFVTAWPQLGGPAGFFLANLAILASSRITGGEFLNWGWRIPFWLSLGLAGIGLWIRRDIPETPIFRRIIKDNQVARKPVIEVLKHRPREIVVTALVQTAQTVASFVYSAFFIVYGTKTLGMSRDFVLGAMLIASCTSFFTIPFSGYLSDRFDRRNIFMIGAAGTGLFAFGYFALLDTELPGLIVLATLIAFFFHNLMWGSVAALTAECFPPRVRYSGTSIGYQFATALAGGTAPMVATVLLLWTGASQMIAIYVFASAIISVAAAVALPDNRDLALNQSGTNETPSWYA